MCGRMALHPKRAFIPPPSPWFRMRKEEDSTSTSVTLSVLFPPLCFRSEMGSAIVATHQSHEVTRTGRIFYPSIRVFIRPEIELLEFPSIFYLFFDDHHCIENVPRFRSTPPYLMIGKEQTVPHANNKYISCIPPVLLVLKVAK